MFTKIFKCSKHFKVQNYLCNDDVNYVINLTVLKKIKIMNIAENDKETFMEDLPNDNFRRKQKSRKYDYEFF